MSSEHANQTRGGEQEVHLTVNDKSVRLHSEVETGEKIKAAAIEQGVQIRPDYLLWEELEDGNVREISNQEDVMLRQHYRFTAVPREHHEVTVTVNEMPVKLTGHFATGIEIKTAAIKQGVAIQPNFVLQEELPNGTSRIIGDHDRVHLRNHLHFTAILPDDNS